MWDVCPTPRQRGQATEIRNPWIVLWWWCQEAEEEEDGWKIGFRFLMAFANWKQRKILICFDGCLSSPCPNCCACVPPWGISWLTDGGIRLSRCRVETALLCTTCFTTSDLLLPLWRYWNRNSIRKRVTTWILFNTQEGTFDLHFTEPVWKLILLCLPHSAYLLIEYLRLLLLLDPIK